MWIESKWVKKHKKLQNEKAVSEQHHKLCVCEYIYSQERIDVVCGNKNSYKIPCSWFFFFAALTLIWLDFMKVVPFGGRSILSALQISSRTILKLV